MTDDQRRALVAAFLMYGDEIAYETTVAVRLTQDRVLGINELLDEEILQVTRRTQRSNRWVAASYRVTDAAKERFKQGE